MSYKKIVSIFLIISLFGNIYFLGQLYKIKKSDEIVALKNYMNYTDYLRLLILNTDRFLDNPNEESLKMMSTYYRTSTSYSKALFNSHFGSKKFGHILPLIDSVSNYINKNVGHLAQKEIQDFSESELTALEDFNYNLKLIVNELYLLN